MTASSSSNTLPDIHLLTPVARLAGVHAASVLGSMLGVPVRLVEWAAEIAPSWTHDGPSPRQAASAGWWARSTSMGGDLAGALEVAIAPDATGPIVAALLAQLPDSVRTEPGLEVAALEELAQILAGAFATVLSGTLQLDVAMSVMGTCTPTQAAPVRLRTLLAVDGRPACQLVLATDQATLGRVVGLLEEL